MVKPANLTGLSLRNLNFGLAALYLVQTILLVLVAKSKPYPVTTTYLAPNSLAGKTGDPALVQATRHLFDINMLYLVAAFLLVAAITHLLVATSARRAYEAGLKQGVNRYRWVEYALSAGLMMVAIGLVSGIADVSTLLLLFAATAVMNLLGLAKELSKHWLAYWIGCVAGLAPWVVLAIYLRGSAFYGSGLPGYAYWIMATIFVCFGAVAAVLYAQSKKVGKWANYPKSERTYMVLGLVAKTLLAWQIFAGVLRP
jgi:hypothetical protein